MKFTAVTEKNASYFDTAIGELYREQWGNRLFFGVLDDEDAAVGAVAWELEGDTLWLLRIGVEDERRRQGFGSFLLRESARFAAAQEIPRLSCSFYETEEEASKNELAQFLSACDFAIRRVPIERQVYALSALYDAVPEQAGELAEPYAFRRGKELDEAQKEAILWLSVSPDSDIPYLNSELLLSEENRYGGVLLKEDRPVAAVTIVPFEDGVRLDQFFGDIQDLSAIRALVRHCVETVKKEKDKKRLYMDVGGEKLIRIQKQVFERVPIPCEFSMQGYVATKGTGEV